MNYTKKQKDWAHAHGLVSCSEAARMLLLTEATVLRSRRTGTLKTETYANATFCRLDSVLDEFRRRYKNGHSYQREEFPRIAARQAIEILGYDPGFERALDNR